MIRISDDETGNGGSKNTDPLHDDPEISDLLHMTREVLETKEGYAESLTANIRSFHNVVKTEDRLDKMDSDISEIRELKEEVADLRKRLDDRSKKGRAGNAGS